MFSTRIIQCANLKLYINLSFGLKTEASHLIRKFVIFNYLQVFYIVTPDTGLLRPKYVVTCH